MKTLSISPAEAWRLDYKEISYLSDNKSRSEMDLTIMLNYQRKLNGASAEFLKL